jgi:hypothetical protein
MPKVSLAALGEDAVDRRARSALDLRIEVNERAPEPRAKRLTYRRLPRARKPDQDDVRQTTATDRPSGQLRLALKRSPIRAR